MRPQAVPQGEILLMMAVSGSPVRVPQPVGSSSWCHGTVTGVCESRGQAVWLGAQWGASRITSQLLVICSNQPAYFMSCLATPDK